MRCTGMVLVCAALLAPQVGCDRDHPTDTAGSEKLIVAVSIVPQAWLAETSSLVTPLLQAHQVHAFSEEQNARHEEYEQAIQEPAPIPKNTEETQKRSN